MKETIAKINKTKGFLFEKIKFTNLQLHSSRKKRLKSNKKLKRKITTDIAEIQRNIRYYYQ